MKTIDIINYSEEQGLSKEEAFDLIKENQLYQLAFENGHYRPNLGIDETLLLTHREEADLRKLAIEISEVNDDFCRLKEKLRLSNSIKVLKLDGVEVTIDSHSLDVAIKIVERELDWLERVES